MQEKFTLTQTDNSKIIHGNIPSDKVLSVRSVFARGFGISATVGSGKTLLFQQIGFSGPFNTLDVNNNQNQSDLGNFNYTLIAGAEISVSCPSLGVGQSIYVEVNYELLDA